MKKIFISLFAVAALAACSKSDIAYENDQVEIGFAPVPHNITKSVAGVEDTTFPTDLDLYVFANIQGDEVDADGNLLDEWPSEYLNNARFVYDRLGSNGVYEGETPRYWPNVKSLIFAGYSNACNIDDVAEDSTVDFDANEISIFGYVQDNDQDGAGENDLMWFPWNGSSYTKQSTAIPAVMQHACSWITVKVLRDANTTDETWTLKGLQINGLYHTGDATCGEDAATWEVYGNTAAETLYTGTAALGTTAEVYEDVDENMVVIPQVPTSINVTYSYVPQEGVAAVTETVKDLDLKIVSDPKSDDNIWESGKHYTYTIKITATEILVAPEVDGWDPVTVTPDIEF